MGTLGHPLKIALPGERVHDLAGADALLPGMAAKASLADKAYDADKRVIKPLVAAGRAVVIPPKSNRKDLGSYDTVLYEARHSIENFFCWNKQYRAIARRTRPPETSSPHATWSSRSIGSIDERP
jgi:transposase